MGSPLRSARLTVHLEDRLLVYITLGFFSVMRMQRGSKVPRVDGAMNSGLMCDSPFLSVC
jgi:hypothetical protein